MNMNEMVEAMFGVSVVGEVQPVDQIDESVESPALLAREAAKIILEDVDDVAEGVIETDTGFAVFGSEQAVHLGHDGHATIAPLPAGFEDEEDTASAQEDADEDDGPAEADEAVEDEYTIEDLRLFLECRADLLIGARQHAEAFDAAEEAMDYDAAWEAFTLIVEEDALDEESLELFEKMSSSQYRKMMKSRKTKTPKEKKAGRARRKAYGQQKGKMRRKAKLYRKRTRRKPKMGLAADVNMESVAVPDVEIADDLADFMESLFSIGGYVEVTCEGDEVFVSAPADVVEGFFQYLDAEDDKADALLDELIGNPAEGKLGKLRLARFTGPGATQPGGMRNNTGVEESVDEALSANGLRDSIQKMSKGDTFKAAGFTVTCVDDKRPAKVVSWTGKSKGKGIAADFVDAVEKATGKELRESVDGDGETSTITFPKARIREFLDSGEKAGVTDANSTIVQDDESGLYEVTIPMDIAKALRPFFKGDDVHYGD